MSQRTSGILFAMSTGLCWALLAITLKYALHFYSTGTIVWARMSIASIMLLTYYVVRYPRKTVGFVSRKSIGVAIAGLFLAGNYFGYMRGLELTSASNAQIMIQVGPLCLLMAGVLYFRETMQPYQWLGVVVAAIGFILFYWDQLLVSLRDQYTVGNGWILFAAVTWAVFAAVQKYYVQFRGWLPQDVNLVVYAVSTLALWPLVTTEELTAHGAWPTFILFLTGLNTVVAYGCFAEALHRIPASQVSLIVSVNPLLTIFLMELIAAYGFTFVSPEPIHWRGYVGAIAVVGGVCLAVLKLRRTGLQKKRM